MLWETEDLFFGSMDWDDFDKVVISLTSALALLRLTAKTAIEIVRKSVGWLGGEKRKKMDRPSIQAQLKTPERDQSHWQSPWQRLGFLEKVIFALDQFMVFGGFTALLAYGVFFKAEPLTTHTGSMLVMLGACAVIGSLRPRG